MAFSGIMIVVGTKQNTQKKYVEFRFRGSNGDHAKTGEGLVRTVTGRAGRDEGGAVCLLNELFMMNQS